jgi:NADPH:quinone reductase-like Zn-dependent oxidoreductase
MLDKTRKVRRRLWIASLAAAAFVTPAAAQRPGDAPRMKAFVHHEYGSPDVLRLEDVLKPVPGDDQILVRVRAAAVNPLDWHFIEGAPYVARLLAMGALAPEIQRVGVDFAGTVEAVGRNVTHLKPGDDVFGGKTGALGEYVCVSADGAIVLKPPGVTFEQAASVPVAAVTALQGLRDKGQLRPGQTVLINGASGGVGTFAVQIAKSFGADVTGVCSTRNVDLVRSIGADRVIDYTKEDFTESGRRYDLILDNVGNHSFLACRRALKPNGIYVLIGGGGLNDGRWMGPFVGVIKGLVLLPFVRQHMGMMMANLNTKDLILLGEMIESGKVTPVIDRRYPFRQVPDAIRYLERGHARGKVIITFDQDESASPVVANDAAKPTSGIGPALIVATFVVILAGVPLVPLIAALALNRRFRRRNPGKRPYRWGYYFSIESLLAGIGLGLMFESGIGAVIACGVLYGVLAWLFARRHHGAWIALTILSLNPVAWIINFFYLRKRWVEDSATAHGL